MPDPFREIEGHREHGQDGDQPALMPRMSDLSSLKCTRAVNMGTGDFGTSISCDPRGLGTQGTTADRKMNAAVRFDCPAWSGRDRCGGRPLLTTQSESWRLHRVAHRPGPGRSEQVRRSGPGPTLSSSLRPPQKKYDGRSRETDRAIETGTSAAKSYRFDASFYLVGCLRMQLRQHNHRNKDNQRGRQ